MRPHELQTSKTRAACRFSNLRPNQTRRGAGFSRPEQSLAEYPPIFLDASLFRDFTPITRGAFPAEADRTTIKMKFKKRRFANAETTSEETGTLSFTGTSTYQRRLATQRMRRVGNTESDRFEGIIIARLQRLSQTVNPRCPDHSATDFPIEIQ